MFTSIFNVMQENQVLNLNLMRIGERLVVCCQPLASNATDSQGSKLTPLVITATPGELDAGFIAAICTPLGERFDMLTNLEEFKKSTQKAQSKTTSKDEVTVASSTNASSKKSKKDEQIEEAEKLYKANNLPGAYGIYKKLYEQDKTDTKIGNRMHELWAIMSQKSIFPAEPVMAVEEPATGNQINSIPMTASESEPVMAEHTQSEEPVVDMFSQLINPPKVEEPVVPREETKASIPTGVDPESYQKFLAYQEFMKTQGAVQPV